MDITAGVQGQLIAPGQEEKCINFLLHEFKISVDPLESLSHCAHPVHKGVRMYVWQNDSAIPTTQVFQLLKQVDQTFSKHFREVDRRLICPSCLQDDCKITSSEGYFNIDEHLLLVDTTCSRGSAHQLPCDFLQLPNICKMNGGRHNYQKHPKQL